MNFSKIPVKMIAATAAVICLLVYLRALSCGFVNFSDPDYVLENPLIRTLDWNMISRAFREPHAGWWMPLTWISFAVDYHFWGLNPTGYHLTNVVLHAVNTALVVLIAECLLDMAGKMVERAGLYSAALLLAGLLWGIHPLRVESVAWVVERKDVLNGLFTFSSALCYLRWVRVQESGRTSPALYMLSLGLFACSLLAKSISVVLPLMLLVLDRYPAGRWKKRRLPALVIEKLPFLALSALVTVVTIVLAGSSSLVVLISNEMFPWHERLLVSGNALLQYLRYLVWPAGITPYHIIPDPVPLLPYGIATALVMVICVFLMWNMRGRLWVGTTWLLFVIPLLPVLSFLQNGDQGYAARFTYIPAVAPCIMASALFIGLHRHLEGRPALMRRMVAVSLVLLLSGYAAMSYRLITFWDNGAAMWTRTIEHAPSSAAYWRRAMYHQSVGNNRAAVADYSAAIELVTPSWRPYLHNLYSHRGEALAADGQYLAAITDLSAAIESNPQPLYFRLRGELLKSLGRSGEAEADLLRAGDASGPLGWYF